MKATTLGQAGRQRLVNRSIAELSVSCMGNASRAAASESGTGFATHKENGAPQVRHFRL